MIQPSSSNLWQSAGRTPAGTYYRTYGERQRQAPVVVLIHGVGLDHQMWMPQVQTLSTYHGVVIYDVLGHGLSPRPDGSAGLEAYADQLEELISHLALDQTVVVGFSMGGLVARAYALRQPSALIGLAILNSVFDRSEAQCEGVAARVAEVERHGPGANVEQALERWFSAKYRHNHPERIVSLRRRLTTNDPQGYRISYRLFAREHDHGIDRLEVIDVPTLVATGEFDVGSTPAMSEALASRIARARCVIVPGQLHMMASEAPDQVNALLLELCQSAQEHALTRELC